MNRVAKVDTLHRDLLELDIDVAVKIHHLKCEILVAGGGPAGVCCALAAARCGADVILCQDRSVLGGNASSEVRMHIVGANGTGRFDRGKALEVEAREGGIIEEIRLENCVRNPQRSAAVFDLILYDKCRSEPKLTLLLNTTVTDAVVQNRSICEVVAERPSTEECFRIEAAIYVDCTGDGRLAFEAGATFMEGRENRQQFGEHLAQATADTHRLGSTILLQARKHECEMPFVAPTWARQFSRDDFKLRLYAVPGEEEPSYEYGYWWAEWGGTLDTIKDNEQIRDELLAIALGIWDHVKNGPPEAPALNQQAANWALDWIGFLPGKRESRRFIGHHILAEQDVLESSPADDAIAFGGWSIDLHPPEGVDAVEQPPCEQHPVPWLFDIPLRCCVSRDLDNLMFAGRNQSATHVAFASTRVMATCAVTGQGVGTTAGFAVTRGIGLGELIHDRRAINQVQQRLLRDDAFLIGLPHREAHDVAPKSRITASSSQEAGPPINVISGLTRSVHGERGVPPDRRDTGTHRWMSDPSAGFPAWVMFEWEQAVRLAGVRLVFDTGMHRHLTLSHHDGYTKRMCWGRPQPETVRDYAIELFDGLQWKLIGSIESNYQRQRGHRFEVPRTATAVRISVLSTNGIDHARLMAVNLWTPDDPWPVARGR